MAFHYDPGAGYFATALRLSGTVVPHVFRHVEFWLFFVLHLAVVWAFRKGYLRDANKSGTALCLGWDEMKVIAAATTFFEVFYTSQCFTRYMHLYDVSRKMLGNLYDFSFECRLHFRKEYPNHVRLAVRWFIASVVLFFYETNANVSDKEWQELLRQGLLKPTEKAFLSAFHRHQRSLILLQWSAVACQDASLRQKSPANVLKSLVDKLLISRTLEHAVIDTIDLPMPFQYFHLLNTMVVVNLLLWAYGMGVTESVWGPVVFFFTSLIFMGMLQLAAALSDPFGNDDVDFPVDDWLNEFLERAIALVEFDSPLAMERRLATETAMRHGRRHFKLSSADNLPSGSFACRTAKDDQDDNDEEEEADGR